VAGETPLEVCVGAILTQNTAWTNVEKAISNLKSAGLMDNEKMRCAGEKTIAGLIRPAGYFNIKASRLIGFLDFLSKEFNGDLALMEKLGLEDARRLLLNVKGIGPETADSMLLYAMNLPVFVIDFVYKADFFKNRSFKPDAAYEDAQRYFMTRLTHDTALFNDYHAQIVELESATAKDRPVCGECPVLPYCKKKIQ